MIASYSNQAEDFLDKRTSKQAERIKSAIKRLPAGDLKKLRGIKNGYRLRVGDVRIVFEKQGSGKIYVLKIDNRGDVYK